MGDAIEVAKRVEGARLLVAGDPLEPVDGYRTAAGDTAEWRLGYLSDDEIDRALGETTVALFPYRPEIDQSGALMRALGAGAGDPKAGLCLQLPDFEPARPGDADCEAFTAEIRREMADVYLEDLPGAGEPLAQCAAQVDAAVLVGVHERNDPAIDFEKHRIAGRGLDVLNAEEAAHAECAT